VIESEEDVVSMDVDDPPSSKKTEGEDLSQYHLDDYDDDGKTTGLHPRSSSQNQSHNPYVTEVGPFSNIKGLTYYRDNKEDPYITLKEVSSPTPPHHPLTNRPHRTKPTTNAKSSRSSLQTTSS